MWGTDGANGGSGGNCNCGFAASIWSNNQSDFQGKTKPMNYYVGILCLRIYRIIVRGYIGLRNYIKPTRTCETGNFTGNSGLNLGGSISASVMNYSESKQKNKHHNKKGNRGRTSKLIHANNPLLNRSNNAFQKSKNNNNTRKKQTA